MLYGNKLNYEQSKTSTPISFILLLSFIFFINCSLSGQTIISGTVKDHKNNIPLIGVSILVENNNKGVVTDNNGKYALTLPNGIYEISFSYLGYKTIKDTIIAEGITRILDIKMVPVNIELNEVIVSASSEARKIREQAMPISVITMDELQGTVSDISDVLSKTAGVKIRSTGGVGSSARISVRGLEGKRIGYFIDETPLSDNSDFIDFNDIPVELIDRVEIYKGIVPAKFGGSSIGGAVNIVLKEYPPKYLDLTYSIQSFNTHKISTVFKLNRNGIEAGIGGFYTYSDNNYKMELPLQAGKYVTRDHDKFEKLTIGGGLKSKKWWFDEVQLEPAVVLTGKEIQGIEYNIQEAKSISQAYVLSNKNEKNNFLTDGLDLEWTNVYAYTIYRFQDKAMQRYSWEGEIRPPVTIFGGEIGAQPNDTYNQKHTYLQKINLDYLINERHSLNFNSVYNYVKGIPEDTLKDKVIGYQTNFNSSMNSLITGLAHEYNSPDKRFTNVITLKYYFYSMKTRSVDLYGLSTIPIGRNLNKHDYGISEAIRYWISTDFLIKASIAHDVRLPGENELLGDGFIIAPAVDLEPERNTSFNLGFMYDITNNRHNRFQFEVNGFYMQLKNMIRFTGGPLQSMYQNFGEMRTLGIESEVKWDATNYLYLWGNITYQDLKDTRDFEPGSKVPNPTKGDRIPNIPYFFANAGLEIHKENFWGGHGQNTRLFTDCSFVEEYFYDFEQSVYQDRKIPRSLIFSAGIEQSFEEQSIFLSIQANNFTNETVLSEFNRPLPGRNFGLKLRYILK
jgi:outer membrane receptor protein involved in Fe transport